MFLASDQHPESTGYDCIVVGSGPAGMTVATELEKAGRRILLLESESGNGDLAPSVGYGHFAGNYWNAHWIRAFGGTSNAWAGWVSTLREIDFDHPAIGVRWPIERADLVPFYKRAAPILGRRTAIVDFERPVMPGWIYHPFSIGDPTRFGDEYRGAIARSKRLDVALGYSVVGLSATPSRSSISAVRCFDHGQRAALTMPIGPATVRRDRRGRNRQRAALAAATGRRRRAGRQRKRPGRQVPDGTPARVRRRGVRHDVRSSTLRAARIVRTADGRADAGGNGRTGAPACTDAASNCGIRRRTTISSRALSTPDKRLYHYGLSARSEMQPVASNHVFLTAERDRAGLLQAAARCVFSASDLLNVERTVRLLGRSLLETDRGRVRVNNDACTARPPAVGISWGRHGWAPAARIRWLTAIAASMDTRISSLPVPRYFRPADSPTRRSRSWRWRSGSRMRSHDVADATEQRTSGFATDVAGGPRRRAVVRAVSLVVRRPGPGPPLGDSATGGGTVLRPTSIATGGC